MKCASILASCALGLATLGAVLPIQSLGWPAMTMDFAIKDTTLLKHCVQGQLIHFAFVRQHGESVITRIR